MDKDRIEGSAKQAKGAIKQAAGKLTGDSNGATPNGDSVPGYFTVNLGVSHTFKQAMLKGFTIRFDAINVGDERYEIRDGTGVGVGAPQFGARRGFFVGLSHSL